MPQAGRASAGRGRSRSPAPRTRAVVGGPFASGRRASADGGSVVRRGEDGPQRPLGTLEGRRQGLATGRVVVDGVFQPALQLAGIVVADLLEREALPLALAQLQRASPAAAAVHPPRAPRGWPGRSPRLVAAASARWPPAAYPGTGSDGGGRRRRQAGTDGRGLASARVGEGRVAAALEAALGEPRGLAVPDEGQDGGRGHPGASRLMSQTSSMASEERMRSAAASGTGSSRARIMKAMERLSERPRCMALMLTSASPRVWPTRPMAPGRSSCRETSMCADGARSIS